VFRSFVWSVAGAVAGLLVGYIAFWPKEGPEGAGVADKARNVMDTAVENLTRRVRELGRLLDEKKGENENLKEENDDLRERVRRLEKEVADLKKPPTPAGTGPRPGAATPDREGDDKHAERFSKEALEKISELVESLERDPRDRAAAGGISELAWLVKDAAALKPLLDRAFKALETLKRSEPENPDLLYNEAMLHYARIGQFMLLVEKDPSTYGPAMGRESAAGNECLVKLLEKAPSDHRARLTLAWAYLQSKMNPAGAEKEFSEIVRRARDERVPEDILERAHVGLVLTYRQRGDKEKARKAAEEGLAALPRSERLRRLLEELEK